MHLADIHIRLTDRHGEWREVFSKVYEDAKKLPESSIITVLGDVLHGKVDLSPEAVELSSEFLKNLADIRHTILVPGNHDCLLTNKTRLDSLSPIVNNLNHKKLHYLKKSGLYGVGNILFNNMSVFNDVTKYLDIRNISKKIQNTFDCKVALFHGGVHGSLTDLGYLIENKLVPRDFFDGHDIVMLGDIHKAQTFFIEKTIPIEEVEEYKQFSGWEVTDIEVGVSARATKKQPIFRYPGSLVMQNHGESITGHGYSLWNIKNRTFEHIEIPNDHGHFTINIDGGKLVTDITNMPSKPRLRVQYTNSVATEVKKIVADVKEDRTLDDLIYLRMDGENIQDNITVKKVNSLNSISDVEYQNKLIEEFLKKKYPMMDNDTLEEVYKISKTTNESVGKDDNSRNIRWKPIRFEFSNMFSYGESNIVDFTKLSDVYGLFAANASGKSSLMDALCFIIFDKSARAFKAAHVINTQKSSFSGKFTFEINSVKYVIERDGIKDKKNNVKVNVKFYKLDGDKQVSLNEEERRSTNEVIRNYLGSYDDFILTSLAIQGNQGSIIDEGQTELKELLAKFIGLTLFDRLVKEASDKVKETAGAIKVFNKEDNAKKIIDMTAEIPVLEEKLVWLNEEKEKLSNGVKELEQFIVHNNSLVVKLENVPEDLGPLIQQKKSIQEKIQLYKDRQQIAEKEISSISVLIESYDKELTSYDIPELLKKHEIYVKLGEQYSKLSREMDRYRIIIEEKLKKLAHLDEHKYDPNCPYCMNNVFVKDAITTREELKSDKTSVSTLRASIQDVDEKMKELEKGSLDYKYSLSITQKRNPLAAKRSRMELAAISYIDEVSNNQNRLKIVDEQIELYERSKEVIEKNHAIERGNDEIRKKLFTTNYELKTVTSKYMEIYGRKISLVDRISLLKSQSEKIENLEHEHAAYEYYLDAVGRDGIPYHIISDVIPQIEQEVNNILYQIVEFGVAIETDGKNVNIFIKYEDRKWPLKMSSGMEKFICALALRVALINISNLPRPNFLVIDEGWGALDANNMAMVHALFDYLKSSFDFIIVISHLDAMRDMVDKQLEIRKENGFSKIDNTA
jgi:DNA repair exonuclease SbcCD ATPase subunit